MLDHNENSTVVLFPAFTPLQVFCVCLRQIYPMLNLPGPCQRINLDAFVIQTKKAIARIKSNLLAGPNMTHWSGSRVPHKVERKDNAVLVGRGAERTGRYINAGK